jgi:predicted permease
LIVVIGILTIRLKSFNRELERHSDSSRGTLGAFRLAKKWHFMALFTACLGTYLLFQKRLRPCRTPFWCHFLALGPSSPESEPFRTMPEYIGLALVSGKATLPTNAQDFRKSRGFVLAPQFGRFGCANVLFYMICGIICRFQGGFVRRVSSRLRRSTARLQLHTAHVAHTAHG